MSGCSNDVVLRESVSLGVTLSSFGGKDTPKTPVLRLIIGKQLKTFLTYHVKEEALGNAETHEHFFVTNAS